MKCFSAQYVLSRSRRCVILWLLSFLRECVQCSRNEKSRFYADVSANDSWRWLEECVWQLIVDGVVVLEDLQEGDRRLMQQSSWL